jgi:hypothetical protein
MKRSYSPNGSIARQAQRLVLALTLCCAWWIAVPIADGAARLDGKIVTREIRYSSAEAGEVALVWGVDGWQMLPAALRPAGTTVLATKGEVMRTPMVNTDGVFTATVRVPAGATIDYIFQVTRTRSGVPADAWDMGDQPERQFRLIADRDGATTNMATIALAQQTYTSAPDSYLQMIGALILLAAGIPLVIVALRLRFKNPYLDF